VPGRPTILEYQEVTVTDALAAARNVATKENRIVIVRRGRPRWAILQCPCGCGDLVSLNLDPRTGPHWRARAGPKGVSISPSVWRTSGCCSHFIVWDSRVWMFRGRHLAIQNGEPPADALRELMLEGWKLDAKGR